MKKTLIQFIFLLLLNFQGSTQSPLDTLTALTKQASFSNIEQQRLVVLATTSLNYWHSIAISNRKVIEGKDIIIYEMEKEIQSCKSAYIDKQEECDKLERKVHRRTKLALATTSISIGVTAFSYFVLK